MSTDISYGKLSKRIVFTENDHRHAKLIVRLKHDNMKQSFFFRTLITGYLNNDERIVSFFNDFKPMSKTRKQKSKKLISEGKQAMENFGFSEKELSNIFDIIEEEHPEL